MYVCVCVHVYIYIHVYKKWELDKFQTRKVFSSSSLMQIGKKFKYVTTSVIREIQWTK